MNCLPAREYFSISNIKTVLRSFIYEYETPKIVTIHSISIALMCRLIQILILVYGIVYLMIHKKGYQEIDTSIISSITLKVKGIGYNQTSKNQTLVIDGADYIVPPQENNALFLMTNFIRTDQEHGKCIESSDEKISSCANDHHCLLNRDFQKANGKWTGRCISENNTETNDSRSISRRCELEGWCPVENDRDVPNPIRDALNFTIFVKNFIEFPRFKVIRKNIQANASYLKQCSFHPIEHKLCPIFRVGTLLDIVEADAMEQSNMLKFGGVIRVKIDWNCNLDKPLDNCVPEYTFGRLDAPYKQESFSHGFNFRFASHWKHENRSYRTLTKAFGLRFIISVSGLAGRFDIITLTLNIGSLIGILGLATFICDIIALYVHRQSDLYRQQKFQDVDLNLLRLESLNAPGLSTTIDNIKENTSNHIDEQVILNVHAIDDNNDILSNTVIGDFNKTERNENQEHYDNLSTTSKGTNQISTPMLIYGNYHQRKHELSGSYSDSPSLSSVKQRRANVARPSQLPCTTNDKTRFDDKTDIIYVDQDSPEINTDGSRKQMMNNKHYLKRTPISPPKEIQSPTLSNAETYL